MKRKSLLIMLLVALFVPLAMNAQTKSLKKSAKGSTQLEMMKVTPKRMSSNPLLTKLESAKEAALEELNGRGERATNELLTQGFESMNSISTTYSSTGWYAYNAGRGNNWTLNTSSTYANNGSKSAQYEYNSRNAANCYLVSAPFTVSSNMSELTVSLYERARGNYPETFEVFFVKASDVTTLNGVASATKYNAIASDSYTNTTYAQQSGTVTNSALAGQSVRVVVHCTSAADQWYLYIDDITVNEKTVEEGCSAPENFAASNVTTNSVTLSWTETGTSDTWVIYYMAEDDETTSYEIAETNPFTLTGLNPVTNYYALVTPYCGDLDQDSDVIEFTTQDLPCPKPTDLNVTAMTPSSATVSWSGEADSYTLQYRPAADNGEAGFFDDFESYDLGEFGDWTVYTQGDAIPNVGLDGWFVYDITQIFSNPPTTSHSGSNSAMAFSYWNGTALTADNWLITPQVQLQGTLKFWVYCSYGDAYEVKLSTGGNAVSDFNVTLQALATAPTLWTEVSIDLSSYNGQPGYIAIHQNQYDGEALLIDDFGIYPSASEAEEWVTINNVTSPYTITGLDSETTYEWQVQGDCGSDGQSLWSDIATFTTLDACAAPTGLTATNITNNSAALSWTGYTDAFNIQYREYDASAPVTLILNVPSDIWGDGTGYQLILDADHNTYGTTIPETANYTAGTFADFEYTIPENAVCDASTNTIIVNGSATITIPAGVYDYVFLNPDPTSGTYYIASGSGFPSRGDDYEFAAGMTYEFTLSIVGQNDYITLTTTSDSEWTPVSGTVTSPYTLTGLDPETTYQWQVKGDGCDNWSASNVFTTINGILVERISADDVEVVVGGTANITNLVVLPADATNPAVTYTSNDETIATVTDAGVVTGVAAGNTTITIAATDGSGVSTTIDVTVNGIDVTGITAENVTVVTGETATINYTVAPNNASDQSVTFTSANTAIATVDEEGVVTGVAVGTTTITIASVSNPEVTATINVTVTSNPNAAQFSVNAPATAHPGDVITVDFVLAAPTAGTYTGFTGLDVNLYFETAAFQYNSKANGAVADAASAIEMSQVVISGPNTNNPNRVRALLVTPANTPVTTEGIVFSATFTVLQDVALGSYTFDATVNEFDYTIDNSNVIDIPYEFTPSEVVIGNQYIKRIIGYNSAEGNGFNYYLIASPIGTVSPTNVTHMLENSYDLYYFNQAGDSNGNEWINYESQNGGGFSLQPGKGYLYANSNTVDLTFTGTASNETSIQVPLALEDCSGASGHFEGWNLVGNPFGQTAYTDRDFYVMNTAGNQIITNDGNREVESMQGIFAIANSQVENDAITFSKTPINSGSKVVLNVMNNQGLADRAIVRFGEGSQLPKFQLFGNTTKVYFPEDDQNYAVVRSANENELPVNFKASSNGSYTMSVNVEELDMDYIHLIDNQTGMDVDLLQTPSYTFEATTSDEESRFRLVFATVDSVNENSFGFVNASGNLCIIGIEGKATVQVIDVLGHVLSSETFSGSYEKHLDVVPGVYMIRLIQGNDVKVQKVVVRR